MIILTLTISHLVNPYNFLTINHLDHLFISHGGPLFLDREHSSDSMKPRAPLGGQSLGRLGHLFPSVNCRVPKFPSQSSAKKEELTTVLDK